MIGAADAGCEQPTLEAFQILLDPLRMQQRDQVHDRGHGGHATNQRDVMIGGVKQVEFATDRCAIAQWQLEHAAENDVNPIVLGQYLRRATRHGRQILAKRVRLESNAAALGHFVEALPERARINTDAVQMSRAFTACPHGAAEAYFHSLSSSIQAIA